MGCQAALLAAIAFLIVGGITAYWLWKSVPADWVRNQQYLKSLDNASKLQIAQNLRNRVVADVTDLGPSGAADGYLGQDRTIHLTFAEVNVWLAHELPTWNQSMGLDLPPQVKGYMLARAGDGLVLRCRYDTPEFNQIVSVEFGVDFLEDGNARLRIEGVRGGLLPVPLGPILTQVRKTAASEERSRHIEGVLSYFRGEPFPPVTPLDGYRQVRLLGYEVHDDGIDVRIRTEPRPRGQFGGGAGGPR
jgi:hypothetical protein